MNKLCDHLSRYPEPERKSPEPEESVLFTELRSGRTPFTTREEIKKHQTKQYPWLFQILLADTGWPTDQNKRKQVEEEVQYYVIKQGVIFRSNLEKIPKTVF
jgi:hypothetical protein